MGKLTAADLALVQAAIDEANASMGRALAVIENAAAVLERSGRCGECQDEGFGDCGGCGDASVSAGNYEWNAEPSGHVYGGGAADA